MSNYICNPMLRRIVEHRLLLAGHRDARAAQLTQVRNA
jgi:hypothetical protein